MLTAVILGLVEGITEFLPVSSTGHLILAGHWLGFTGARAATFEIFIQSGAILAVVFLYFSRFTGFLDFKARGSFRGLQGIALLVLTTLPALVFGFLFHDMVKKYLFNPWSVAAGFFVGGLWILWAEHRPAAVKKQSLDRLSWRDAAGIGFFQCLALWPGFSRSGATILGGMTLGLDRKTAAEYSFFAAVPLLTAAAVLDLLKSIDQLQAADFPFFAAGFVVSFISAWIVIRFFISFVSRQSLAVFGWYRLAAAVLILAFWKP